MRRLKDRTAFPPCADPRRAALVLALCLAAGCSQRNADPGPPSGGTLTLALRDSLSTYDPAFAWDPLSTPFLHLLYEGLVAFDDSGTIRPACAGRWQASADSLTWRFELRPGLRYASGARVTAADFRFALERLFRNGRERSPGAPEFAALEGALRRGVRRSPPLGIDAPDERTLVLHLAWPDPSLLEKLAQPRYAIPVPESAAARAGSSYGAFPETNGPYRLERAGDDTFLFTRNPYYALVGGPSVAGGGATSAAHRALAGYPDTIRVLTGVVSRNAMLGLESGRLDLLWPLPTEYRERLLGDRRLRPLVAELAPPMVWLLAFNCEFMPMARRDARRAVALGINRPRLSEEFGERVTPWRSFMADDPDAGEAPGFDPAEGRAALDSARYRLGMRLPVTVPRATGPAFAADALTSGMARASIQFDLLGRSHAEWARAVLERRGVQATILPFQPPGRDGLDALTTLLLNRGMGAGWGGNWAWYRPSAGLDSLLLRGLRESDPVARRGLGERVVELLESDLPVVPLARVREEAVVRPAWSGGGFHPRYGLALARFYRSESAARRAQAP